MIGRSPLIRQIRRLTIVAALVLTSLGYIPRARALDFSFFYILVGTASAGVLAVDVVNVVYIARGPSPLRGHLGWGIPGTALGTGGMIYSVSAMVNYPDSWSTWFIAGASAATLGLGIWNTCLYRRAPGPPRAALLPAVIPSPGGTPAPGLALAGRF